MTVQERFDDKYIPEPNSGCWLWVGASDKKGYGRFRTDRKEGRSIDIAHRFSWMLYVGPLEDGQPLLHKCDVPCCVNPDHLFIGSLADNNQDMAKKGRHHNTLKTKCPRGHDYTKENTYIGTHGDRNCKLCGNRRKQINYWRNKNGS